MRSNWSPLHLHLRILCWWALFRIHCLSPIKGIEYCRNYHTHWHIPSYCFTSEVAQTVLSSNVAKTLSTRPLSIVTCANLKIEVLNLKYPYMARLWWLFIHFLILWWSWKCGVVRAASESLRAEIEGFTDSLVLYYPLGSRCRPSSVWSWATGECNTTAQCSPPFLGVCCVSAIGVEERW